MGASLFTVSSVQSVNVVELDLPPTPENSDLDRLNESLLGALGTTAGARANPGTGASGSWVIDLSNLEYAGSAVLGLLVNFRQRVRQVGGRLVLCGLSPRLEQIFRTCSLERLFRITGTRDEAVRAAK